MKINHILTESLLFEQQLREDPIYKSFRSIGTMIVERQMTQQEIQAVFKAVADGAAAGGNIDKEGDAPVSNRTLLGKGADVAGKVSQAFDAVKTKISQSGPVSGFDVAFDNMQGKLLAAAGGEKGAIGKALAKYKEFAIKHPVMQGAIYSGLIALAGISGAGLGGAALLAGIKTFDKLLQGNKASSALWSGFKTGALAYGASKLGDYIKGQQQHAAVDGEEILPVQGTEGMSIAGQPVVPGQPLSDTQMAVMQQSIAAGNQYPPEIIAQYNAQLSGAGNAVAQGASNAAGVLPGQFDGGQYTIMKGDTLGHIAQANGVSVQDLKGLNPQIDFSKAIQPGMTLELPATSDNAGSVWQGYTGGTYGDAAAKAATKGATGSISQGIDNASQAADAAANAGGPAANLTPDFDPNKVPDGWTLKTSPQPIDTSVATDTGPVTRGIGGAPKGANFGDDYLKKVIAGEHPKAMISPEDAQKALDWKAQNAANATDAPQLGGTTPGGNGFSREYLEKVINGTHPRPMVSVEKAKQLLGQSYVNPKPMLEYIDREATVRSWVLRESVGKPRGGVALTEAGRQAIFRAVVNEGPTWDSIKQGAGQFVKGMGQGFTNPGVRNIKNMDTSQMAGAQVGAAGNKFAKGYGKLAGMVQKGADAVGGVLKKGWDSASNKITYDKLDLNWRKNYKEFDPTGGKGAVDSEVVAKFLRAQGVKDGLITSVYKQLGIPMAAAGTAPATEPQDKAQTGTAGATTPAATAGATATPGQTTTTTTTSKQADPTAPNADNLANKALGKVAGGINGLNAAVKYGANSSLGQSLVMPTRKDRTTTTPAQTTTTTATQTTGTGATQPATAATAAEPTQATATTPATTKAHTGGKVAGQLSQTPGAIKKRQARAAAAAAKAGGQAPATTEPAAAAPAKTAPPGFDYAAAAKMAGVKPAQPAPAMPKFGPGVSPQMTAAPSKVSFNIPKNLGTPAKAAPAAKAAPKQPQMASKINRGTPVSEQIDLAEVLWRKMKSK